MFDVDDKTGISPDYECYKKGVKKLPNIIKCNFGGTRLKTVIHTHQISLNHDLKTYNDTNDKDRIIVIDNTSFPKGGAYSMDSLILEYVNHSTYNMKYNLMDMNIYMGVGSLFLMFAAFSLCYLGC